MILNTHLLVRRERGRQRQDIEEVLHGLGLRRPRSQIIIRNEPAFQGALKRVLSFVTCEGISLGSGAASHYPQSRVSLHATVDGQACPLFVSASHRLVLDALHKEIPSRSARGSSASILQLTAGRNKLTPDDRAVLKKPVHTLTAPDLRRRRDLERKGHIARPAPQYVEARPIWAHATYRINGRNVKLECLEASRCILPQALLDWLLSVESADDSTEREGACLLKLSPDGRVLRIRLYGRGDSPVFAP